MPRRKVMKGKKNDRLTDQSYEPALPPELGSSGAIHCTTVMKHNCHSAWLGHKHKWWVATHQQPPKQFGWVEQGGGGTGWILGWGNVCIESRRGAVLSASAWPIPFPGLLHISMSTWTSSRKISGTGPCRYIVAVEAHSGIREQLLPYLEETSTGCSMQSSGMAASVWSGV